MRYFKAIWLKINPFIAVLNSIIEAFVEKKQLFVSFFQIIVDMRTKPLYYYRIVIRKSDKRVPR